MTSARLAKPQKEIKLIKKQTDIITSLLAELGKRGLMAFDVH